MQIDFTKFWNQKVGVCLKYIHFDLINYSIVPLYKRVNQGYILNVGLRAVLYFNCDMPDSFIPNTYLFDII